MFLPDLHTDFSGGRSGGMVFPSLSEFSTVCCDPHRQRLWHSQGSRDQIANIHCIIEKAREFKKNIYFCFVDYAKAMDCSLPGSSVHGIFQAIVLEWITISFSRGSSQPRGSNPGLPHCRHGLPSEPPGKSWLSAWF